MMSLTATATEPTSVYEPSQAGLIFPRVPVFETVEEERLHRKQRLAAACRIFARQGFSYGAGGHLTVRDPEHPELFWTNPMCVPFSMVKTSTLVLADAKGRVLEGDYAINRAGYVLHSEIHAANPDIVASCHAHTTHGAAWSAMGREIPPNTQDACMFFGDHVVVSDDAGKVPVGDGSGLPIAMAFQSNRAIIHQNHGLLTASRHSIDDAVWSFITLHKACQVQLLIEASGAQPKPVAEEYAAYTSKHLGTPAIGFLSFQPYYAEVAAGEPDLFD